MQIANTGLSQIRAQLSTLKSLTASANTSGQTTLTYATLDAQFQSTLRDIDRIVARTTFNGSSILDGFAAPVAYVGDRKTDAITLAIPDVSSVGLGLTTTSLSNAGNATAATSSVTDADALVEGARSRKSMPTRSGSMPKHASPEAASCSSKPPLPCSPKTASCAAIS